ncbi:MAG: lipid IV(A) 3-deoxy-D-manno-octulosonic acid transferase [Burkholderiales bacterium]|nr:MAG: lipid IV(A) 3-deoxy-D-manno-octulosonic acid transferase [Burkholderiales bacterium]
MALAAYSAAWWLAAPLAALYLLWRSLAQREYRRHWGERFLGRGAAPPAGRPLIWVHAVSVGETRAAQPLIEQLARELPEASFLLTHTTPTGRAVGQSIVAALAGRVAQRYLPYDLRFAVARFLHETRPSVGVIMETEVWPNLLQATRRSAVPMLLANARLSEKSAARGRRFAALLEPAAEAFDRIAAQSDADRARIARWYGRPIDVTGNLKFDLAVSGALVDAGRALRAGWGERPLWLFASTRDGEEALLLDAWMRRGGKFDSDPNLLIVPRHPQRFDEVAQLIEARGLACLRRSRGVWPQSLPAGTVLLGDTMGEMALYYAAADVALIGGSLRDFGAQNLIEACAVGTPVVLGPSTFNFAQAAADATAAGAALQVGDADEALAAMDALCRDPQRLRAMGEAALGFASAHRGATARVANLARELLPA